MAKKETEIMPSVLAYEKKLVVSDGYMYGTTWNNRSECAPLHLLEKSVRGTISHRLSGAIKNDPMKLNAEIEKSNPQTVDACALKMNQDTLKLIFSIKVLSGIEKPSACNNTEFYQKYAAVAENYIKNSGFHELAKRYAINIANGRYLWRNRLGAEKIEVIVKLPDKKLTFNAYDYSLKEFEADEQIEELAALIAKALSGTVPYLLIEIETNALVGKGQEVYPSEELVFNKDKNDKSKILYQVDNIAAMHSQKIGNAIRTIDTWYKPEDKQPIAIDPYGAVTTLGKAYRNPKDKIDFFTLFDQYVINGKLEAPYQEHEDYVMAVLVRGGVFGKSGKEG